MIGERVRIAPSYLLRGSDVAGEVTDEGVCGVCIRDTDGVIKFFPWTSVGYIVRNPDVEEAAAKARSF